MKRAVIFIIFFASLWQTAEAQLTKQQKAEAIDSIVKLLNERYIFPETAKQMEVFLRKQQAKKIYDTFSNGESFAVQLTADLRSICKDKHVSVQFSAETVPVQRGSFMQISEEERAGYAEWLRIENFGVNKLDVLKGNIGYINFQFLCGTEFAGDFYAAMMNYVQHTDALIIDFRHCRGAMSDNVISFLCSYLFEDKTHLNDLYWRERDFTQQTWTQVVVPGRKYLNKPVYVLTSGSTFSGAEEMAYDLKNLKRATIIGEVTGGGANPGGSIGITDHFNMFLPVGRAINPITKTNWEGVGVQPDTVTLSKLALNKAHLTALHTVLTVTTNQQRRDELQKIIAQVEKETPVFVKVSFRLKGFSTAKEVSVAGSFNDWSPNSVKMQKEGNDWVVHTLAEPGRHMYKFVVDGNWIVDPGNAEQAEENGFMNSVIVVK